MARQPGLFDLDERLRRLSNIGDQLEAFAAVVDFEMFRPDLVAALNYSDGAKGGRPPFDPVLMFKILVIQAQNNLSDDRAEFLINDRLSFMRFLGLGLTDKVPDAKTIWAFRERLTRAGAIEALFARFDRAIREAGAAQRRSAIDGRTTRHPGYARSQRIRKRIEEVFGWLKTFAGWRKTRFRGLDRTEWGLTLARAYNLVRMPKLLAEQPPAALRGVPANSGAKDQLHPEGLQPDVPSRTSIRA